MVSQIHAYEFDDEIRGAYWDIWREYADDDADFLLSVPSSMLHQLEQVVAEAGYGMHKHPTRTVEAEPAGFLRVVQ